MKVIRQTIQGFCLGYKVLLWGEKNHISTLYNTANTKE